MKFGYSRGGPTSNPSLNRTRSPDGSRIVFQIARHPPLATSARASRKFSFSALLDSASEPPAETALSRVIGPMIANLSSHVRDC